MAKGLKVAKPPTRRANAQKQVSGRKRVPTKLSNIAGTDTVQFNKRIQRATADGFDILAIKLRRKVPDLLDEALEILEEKYGKI